MKIFIPILTVMIMTKLAFGQVDSTKLSAQENYIKKLSKLEDQILFLDTTYYSLQSVCSESDMYGSPFIFSIIYYRKPESDSLETIQNLKKYKYLPGATITTILEDFTIIRPMAELIFYQAQFDKYYTKEGNNKWYSGDKNKNRLEIVMQGNYFWVNCIHSNQ